MKRACRSPPTKRDTTTTSREADSSTLSPPANPTADPYWRCISWPSQNAGVTDQVVHGVHEYDDDPRNEDVLIHVNGELKHRAEAVVSVFDSGFVLGDGVWEGLRVHGGHPVFLDEHLDRLYEGAKAIALDIGLEPARATRRDLPRRCSANGMTDGVHVRLMVTRGVKRTPYQDPRMTMGPATIVIIPEYKQPSRAVLDAGIRLFTVHVRRPYPGRARPQAEHPQQAQRHHRLHPGVLGGRRRGVDARPARLRRHLQLHALLHRPARRAVDVVRRVLPRRHHAGGGAAGGARGRHPDLRARLQPDRRLRRRRGLRHRHLRRDRAGQRGRWTQRSATGTAGRSWTACGRSTRPPSSATSPRRHAADGGDHRARGPAGGVVGPTQHLDRAHAGVGEPPRHDGGRRAAVRPLPRGHRPGPSGPGRGDRRRRARLARGRAPRCSVRFPTGSPSSTRST